MAKNSFSERLKALRLQPVVLKEELSVGTSEEVAHGGRETLTGPPQELQLLLPHASALVLVVQTAKEEAIIAHLRRGRSSRDGVEGK